MATAEITPRAVFSLRHLVRHNAHYISDFQILYPAGSVLIMHNYVEKRQRYIKLFEKSVYLEMITVSPSRKFAAIIQNSERGQIVVFDMQTLKKRRVLNLPHESLTNRFETITFSHDDMYIMAITGEPDWNLVCYNWTKGKVSSMTKAIHPGSSATVNQVCCSPASNGELLIIGRNLFRLMSLNETVWRQYGFQKVDQLEVTSGAWLNADTIICGTANGKLFFVENGELKGVFNAFSDLVVSVKDKVDVQFQQVTSSSLLAVKNVSGHGMQDNVAVWALIAFPKGFAYSCGMGYVHLFEKDKNKYKKRNVFLIDDPIVQDLHSADINVVRHLSINVSHDKLLATTNRAQLYMVRLWGPDLNVAPYIPFRHLGEPLHNGSINGLALCVWKPIFATSGKFDRTIQIWNFETETVQILKRFTEDIFCIDIHPTGTFMAIGFADRVDFSLILMNDIQFGRSVPFRNCSLCSYSLQGNYLGLASENVVEIYSTVMYNAVHTLKGHIGKVSRMRWTFDNKRLITCGMDGYILIWDIIKGELSGEIQTPGVCYLDIALPADGKVIYAVGDDGLIKEIVDGNIQRVVGMNQSIINNITISRSNLFVSAGTSDVMSIKMPLTNPPDYTLYPFHATKVTEIKLSFDDSTLITVSDGGSIILWKLNLGEEKTVAVDKNFMYSTEVLINKTQLEQHILTMKNLSQRLYEMEMGQAREMRDTENRYAEKIKVMHESYASLIEELKEKIEETETLHRSQLVTMGKEIDQLKQTQENEKKTMIENYTAKLKVEYEKVRNLDVLKEETVKNFDEMVKDLKRCKEEETNEMISIYEQKLLDVENALKESHEENLKNIEEHEISKQYLEDDADRELVETKAKYEKTLKEEKEQNVTLKEETVHMRKKFAEAHKERIDFRVKLELLQAEEQKLQLNIQSLEKDIADLKTEIVDRDTALKEKDEKIILLKKRIQEMEKYKFVLEYKIKELKNQIDPKDREIRERKEEMLDMEVELANLQKMNSSLELQVSELKEKITGTEKEVASFERLHNTSHVTLKQIKIDIYSLYQELNDHKKLKDGIVKLYHKYSQDDVTVSKDLYGDTDAQREYVMQREFLEKTILALKSTLNKSQQNKSDRRKVLQDNVVLLEELNNIRKQMKETVTAVRNLENMIGMKYNKSMAPSEAYGKMQQAVKKQEGIKESYEEVIRDAERETKELSAKARDQEGRLINLVRGDLSDI